MTVNMLNDFLGPHHAPFVDKVRSHPEFATDLLSGIGSEAVVANV